jgi:hypothetical protein
MVSTNFKKLMVDSLDDNRSPQPLHASLGTASSGGPMIEQVAAKNAKPAIKKMLLGSGGSVTLAVGNSIRILSQSAIDRPRVTLPWPLKRRQPRSFRYRVYQGNALVEEQTFDRKSVDIAIAKLLADVPPEEQIVLRPD